MSRRACRTEVRRSQRCGDGAARASCFCKLSMTKRAYLKTGNSSGAAHAALGAQDSRQAPEVSQELAVE
jgi:hypothetical protein